MSALSVSNLRVRFPRRRGEGWFHPVDGVTLSVEPGEMLAVVGESGSGKSLTCLALLRLLPPPGEIAAGSAIRVDGADVLALDAEGLRQLRGGKVGMVFQDPAASLDPLYTAGAHVIEALRAHHRLTAAAARARAIELLREVGVGRDRVDAYPHQLSGGQRQRVMIAAALAGEPTLLIADEPTSALDVTVQAQLLDLLGELRARRGMAILFVSHDLALVATRADRVTVMYAGKVVETGPTSALFADPAHPYTRALLAATPSLNEPDRVIEPIPGGVPDPKAWPPGCRFHPRCAARFEPCDTREPEWFPLGAERHAQCWLHGNANGDP